MNYILVVMKLQIESGRLEDYLKELSPIIQFHTPLVQEKIQLIKSRASNDLDRAQLAFEIARDEVSHSFDTKEEHITINAEDVLEYKGGICFAKSHLLAALLRGMSIPTGFCYQRVLRKGTIDSGYALHGLNAIYLPDTGWFRVDPRGNKLGINSQFNTKKEQLAYPIRVEFGEVDYPQVFAAPLPSVIEAMRTSKSSGDLFYKRPAVI